MTFTFALHYFMSAVLYPFLIFLYFGIILTPKYKNKPIWFYALLAVLLVQPINLGRMVDENSILFEILAWLQLLCILGYVVLFFREKIWEKLLMVIFWSVTSIISEMILSASLGDLITELDFIGDDPVAMIYEIVIYIITFSILGAIGVAWKLLKRKNVPKNILLFLLFPISQYLMVCNVPMDTHTGKVNFPYPWYTISSLLIGIIADVILFYVMFTQGEKEKIKQQLEETEKLMNMEKSYHETVELQWEEMSKIRHDFGNQLTTALHIAHSGEQEKSVEFLEKLRDDIENRSGQKWCENPVINAVVLEKSMVCARENIQLAAQIDASKEMSIQPLHLCSIFSNLLDNAISAAKESEKDTPVVSVHARQEGRYYFVKVENSSKNPKNQEKRPGHGYGLQIIGSIVEQYNGKYEGKWEAGVYTAVVIMEL